MPLVVFILYFFFLSGSIRADDLGTIVVTDRAGDTVSRDGSRTVIELSDTNKQISSLPEVLDREPGVHLRRVGGLESFTSISIRGSSADDVDISLDGISLQSARGNGVDLSPFLLGALDSIEIYRGFSPMQNSATPSAGSVLLKSKRIRQGIHFIGQAGYGSFNTWENHLSLTYGQPRWGFLISQSLSGTQGNFSFDDDNGTPFNSLDDRRVARKNNQALTVYPLFKIYYQFDDNHRLEWINHFIHKQAGVPGLSTNQSDEAHVSTTNYLTALKWTAQQFFLTNLSFESLTSVRLVKSQYSDLEGEIGLGGAQDNDDDTTTFNQKLEWNYAANPFVSFKFLSDYQFERYRPENFLATPSKGAASLRHTLNFSLGADGEFFGGKLGVHPGAYLVHMLNDINNDDPSFLTPATFVNESSSTQLGGQFKLDYRPLSFVSFYSQINRGFRFPTFPELFGDRGGVVGNALIKPETSLNWEAGLSFQTSRQKQASFDWQANYFERRVSDLIQFQQQSGFARAQNIGRAKVYGLETTINAQFSKYLDLTANYTFQNAQNQQTGRKLVGRPLHEVEAKVTGRIKNASLFVSGQWSDEMFLDPLNTRVVSSRFIFNSGLSYQMKDWSFGFEGKNLTNDQIVDVVGYPLPGRSFFGKVTYDFSSKKIKADQTSNSSRLPTPK